jgi:hypothetical protein
MIKNNFQKIRRNTWYAIAIIKLNIQTDFWPINNIASDLKHPLIIKDHILRNLSLHHEK